MTLNNEVGVGANFHEFSAGTNTFSNGTHNFG